MKFSIRQALDHGNLDEARNLLQKAEKQLGNDSYDDGLRQLSRDLYDRETAPNSVADYLPRTNDGHVIDNVSMDAVGDAANNQRTPSFAGEVQLGSYGDAGIVGSSLTSQNSFESAVSDRPGSKSEDPDYLRRQYPDYFKHTGALQTADAVDDGIGAAAATLDIGMGIGLGL